MLNTTPLTGNELDALDQLLLEYGNDDSILDVSELDGPGYARVGADKGKLGRHI